LLDASRAVGVVSALLNPDAKVKFDVNTRMDYERLRGEHANRTREKKMLTVAQARENRLTIDWTEYLPPVPEFLGVRALSSAVPSEDERSRGATEITAPRSARGDGMRPVNLTTLIDYIDWSPFF